MDKISSIEISSISDLVKRTKSSLPLKRKWIFRGQPADWPLTTSLERLCSALDIPQSKYGREIENILLREFHRRFHHYEIHVPQPNDKLEWLAAMQHYGASTRLLDWTYSPYVALYFALERAAPENNCSVVWAINIRWLQDTAMKIIEKHPEYMSMDDEDKEDVQNFMLASPTEDQKKRISNWLYHLRPSPKFVFPATPFNLNTRLTVQKGLFISPADVTESFVSNIEAMPGIYDGYGQTSRGKKNIMKFCIHRDNRRSFLRSLQTMNVSADSLIPGLDGFARSLSIYHHRFDELK